MTDRKTLLAAGKNHAAIASGRGPKNAPRAEELMSDPRVERQGKPSPDGQAENEMPNHPYPPRQAPLLRDNPLVDLAMAKNDADDKSDEPATDHEADGWRAIPPSKP